MKFRFEKERENGICKIDDLLPRVVDSLHFGNSFLILSLQEKWKKIAGDIIATHSIPDKVYKKNLIIKADHSVFAADINMMSEIIVKSINNEFGTTVITGIRVEIKKNIWS